MRVRGLTAYGTALGITQITAAGLAGDAADLQAAMTAFDGSRAPRTAASAVLHTASNAAKKFLSDARGVLVVHRGGDYSQNWASAGWTNNSTAVPDTLPGHLDLVQAPAGFLAANASFAVNAPPLVFTQAQAASAVGAADTAANAKDGRTADDDQLRRYLRALIGILNLVLTPNDPRWAAFGLNAPGKAVTPAAPTNLQSFPALAGQIHATCDTPAGTDHFRWFTAPAGGKNLTHAADTAEAEILLTGQPAGQTVHLRATAADPAGESVPSAPISVAVA